MSGTLLGMPRLREVRPPTRTGRSYYLRTFGCQMNEHDSERIAGLLEADGMARSADVAAADVIVLNTCCIRENADNKLYGNLGHLKTVKEADPNKRIIVGGCLAQKDRDFVRAKAPWVDVVLGTHNVGRIVDLLDHAEEWGPITEVWDEAAGNAPAPELPTRREAAHTAWVTIMVGCNNSCTFCIVPQVRGREISRRPGDIVGEVEDLVADGVVEVTLLGQNVNSYGRDLDGNGRRPLFSELLARVGAVPGLHRVRYTSPHPKDFGEEVAAAMAGTPAVCEQLHLPLQSGSDRILAAMHRGYTAARFLDKLATARRLIPGLTVSTDIIVGFPGETDTDFAATMETVAAARFDSAFTFIYSPRSGTPAADLDSQIAPALVRERYLALTDLQDRIALEHNEAMVGAVVEILCDGPSKKDPAMAAGRTRGGKLVHLPAAIAAGTFVTARITQAAPHHLFAEVVA